MIKALLEKYRLGTCTPEELEQLQQHFQLNDDQDILEWLEEDWQKNEFQATTDPGPAIWNRLEQSIQKQGKKPQLKVHKQWRVAAAIGVLLLALGWLIWPADAGRPTLLVQENTSIKPLKVSLEDGSFVWLNQNSKITYPQSFPDTLRHIRLEGEAFFEVSKDAARPFRVEAGDVITRVLGTAFNVRAYPDDPTIDIALAEGSVSVGIPAKKSLPANPIVLKPMETLSFIKQDTSYNKTVFAEDRPYGWKDGVVYFEGASLAEILRMLEDYYAVKFIFQNPQDTERALVYRLDTRSGLEEVLKDLTVITSYKFEPDSNQQIHVKQK